MTKQALRATALLLVILPCMGTLAAQARRRRAERVESPPPAVGGPAASAVQIAVGGDHSCARMSDGRVLCWGNDVILTLLSPRTSILGPRLTPTPLVRVHDATDLVMQGSQPIVRVGTDRLVSWSWDVARLGTTAHSPEDWQTDALEIANVPPLRIVASASGQSVCSIDAGQVMRCRGDNQFGQLGASSDVVATEDWLGVDLGRPTSASHGGETACAIAGDGTLWCFGRGISGTLGDGTTTAIARRGVQVVSIVAAREVAVSRSGHACAIDAGQGVLCWGRGREGQLGRGTAGDAAVPARVTALGPATRVAVGRYASCAIVSGHVWCWGAGSEGQLGNGATQGSSVPVEVIGLERITQLALGDAHACALRDDGAVLCWGRNTEGSCGAPAGVSTAVPVRVPL